MKRLLALLLCAGMLLGMLAGCAQEETAHVPTGNGLTWDDEETSPHAPTTEEDANQAIVMAYYPNLSMNPYESMDYTNRALFSLIYQSLFVVDENYEVWPVLCHRYQVSEDMMYYTIYPDSAACFSDGDAVTAEDVAASLQAARESDFYEGRFSHVVNISVTGDGGVLIQLDTPYENLPLILNIPIVKAEQVNATSPLGTGPYVFTMTGPNASLVRVADWWCSASLPIRAETIPLVQAVDPVDIRDRFEFSDVSLVCADPGSDSYADYRCDYELWDCENGIFVYLGCNTESGVFSNPSVRSALTFAIDRDSLVEEYYRGFAESVTLPCSPQSPYYDHNLASMYEYQSALFTQAVKKAGVEGQTVQLLTNLDDTLRLRTAQSIARMLTDCGLVVELVEKHSEEYYTALQYKEYDLYLGQTRLPMNMDLTEFFYEDGKISFGPMNDEELYARCIDALENSGNYYDLHQDVMNDGRLCPILVRSYAIYVRRGMIDDMAPSRDNLFYYHLGRTMDDALIDREAEPDPAETTQPQESGEEPVETTGETP